MPPDPAVEPALSAVAAIAGSLDAGAEGLAPWSPDPAQVPAPDPDARPEGFLVLTDGGVRLHYHDWGGPGADDRPGEPPVLLLPGLLQPAWTWAPVARRLSRVRRTVVADLRGQGLSDAALEGYDTDALASDAVAVAEGAGLLDGGAGLVVTGLGLGAIVAARGAARLGGRCAGLVLADGGFERLEVTTGVDVDEFLRGLDEPPEILRSMAAYFADRRDFDPRTWDEDQERAALDAVVETAAGHVVRAVRPFVIESLVRAMFAYDPLEALGAFDGSPVVLFAAGSGDAAARLSELRRVGQARAGLGRPAIRLAAFADPHNLARYRPADVCAAVLGATG